MVLRNLALRIKAAGTIYRGHQYVVTQVLQLNRCGP